LRLYLLIYIVCLPRRSSVIAVTVDGLAIGGPMRVYVISFGLIMLVGGGFAVFNSRRMARL
jgi:hypothetical protein